MGVVFGIQIHPTQTAVSGEMISGSGFAEPQKDKIGNYAKPIEKLRGHDKVIISSRSDKAYCFSFYNPTPTLADDIFKKMNTELRVSRQRTRLSEQIRIHFFEDQPNLI